MTESNVVQMVPQYRGIKDAEEAMTVLRNAIEQHDPVMIANRIGVNASCIYAIRCGRTKWPRHGTFFALIDVLGLEMTLRPRRV